MKIELLYPKKGFYGRSIINLRRSMILWILFLFEFFPLVGIKF